MASWSTLAWVICSMTRLADAAPPHPSDSRDFSLLKKFGLPKAQALIESSDASQRERGIRKLLSQGEEGVERLARTLRSDPGTVSEPELKLYAVRALASHIRTPVVQEVLAWELTNVSQNPDEHERLVAGTCAMALARDGSETSLSLLVDVLRSSSPSAKLVEDALVAYPPRAISVLLARKAMTPLR